MDSALNENEAELGILVFSELLKMLSDGDGLLDKVVKVLGHLGSQAVLLQDSENFAASDTLNLGNASSVSESDADLGWGAALLGKLDDLFNEVASADLDP